jgi:hypothetical protein
LACSSDKSTIHVFAVHADKYDTLNGIKLADEDQKVQDDDDQPENKKSKLSMFKGILPKYFESEWSFAKFRIPKSDTS